MSVRLCVPLLLVSMRALSQQPAAWHDPSPHRIQFVAVQEGVRLEVLDWGGTGRSLVLLAGSGNTAHVFDDLAPKLAGVCHVYGITRRGYGASSQPAAGYDGQRLVDDIVAVLDALRLKAPILVGHSAAGNEITTLASEYPDRASGLIYLSAIFDPRDYPASDPNYMALFAKLPHHDPPPPATPGETRSFDLSRARQMRNEGFAFPESELRNSYETNADGSKGRYKTPQSVFKAIGDGETKRDYSKIRVPVLAIDESAETPGQSEADPADRAFAEATAVFLQRWKRNLQNAVPTARFVDLPGAGHYVFLTREAAVLREMKAFVSGLD